VGGIPPAEPSQFRSDIFKQTPPSPSDFIVKPEIATPSARNDKEAGGNIFLPYPFKGEAG